jgi:hypothetical protein
VGARRIALPTILTRAPMNARDTARHETARTSLPFRKGDTRRHAVNSCHGFRLSPISIDNISLTVNLCLTTILTTTPMAFDDSGRTSTNNEPWTTGTWRYAPTQIELPSRVF